MRPRNRRAQMPDEREQFDDARDERERGVEDEAIDLSEALSTDELVEMIESLEKERAEAVAAKKRALADFANFERRARENEQRARQEGARHVLRSILPVVDHFDLALSQDPKSLSVEQLYGGVKIVRDELVKALEAHGVARIEPRPNDPFDPQRHQAMMHTPVEGIEPGHVVATLQPGFAVGGAAGNFVLRPAKVSVASHADHAPTDDHEQESAD